MESGADFVFLIGAARSGTKFLRDVLAQSQDVAAVPFDVNYVWRYGNEDLPDDCIQSERASEGNRRYVAQTLRSMAARAKGERSEIILEKSVSNALRVSYLHALFPEARFIHLVRDGRDVAESASRVWDAPSDYRYIFRKLRYFPLRNVRYGSWFVRNALKTLLRGRKSGKIWGPRYPGINEDIERLSRLEVAGEQWKQSVTAAVNDLQKVPSEKRLTVYYEELVRGPDSLDGIKKFLEISDPEKIHKAYKEMLLSNQNGKWRRLPLEQQKLLQSIQEPVLNRMGYSVETVEL